MIDPEVFIVPPCVTIDTSMYYVIEEKQVDSIIINNLDVRGEMPSVGSLMMDNFIGMNMADGVFVFGEGPFR